MRYAQREDATLALDSHGARDGALPRPQEYADWLELWLRMVTPKRSISTLDHDCSIEDLGHTTDVHEERVPPGAAQLPDN